MGKTKKGFKFPRKYSKGYCMKTTCKNMGFTQRSSCRPYKNCFKKLGSRRVITLKNKSISGGKGEQDRRSRHTL